MSFILSYALVENISSLSRKELKQAESELGKRLYLDALRENFGIEFPKILLSENGKPYIEGGDIYFNISHSYGFVVCAVSQSDIGVDVELIDNRSRQDVFKLAKRFFTDGEIKHLEQSDFSSEAFYHVWTRKEAYCKLNDIPLALALSHDTMLDNTSTIIKDKYIISIAQH